MNGRAAYVRATPPDLHGPLQGESQIGAWATPTSTDRSQSRQRSNDRRSWQDWSQRERWPDRAARSEAINQRPIRRAWPSCESSVRRVSVADAKRNETDAPRSPKKENRGARGDGVLTSRFS